MALPLDPDLILRATPPRMPRRLVVRERLALARPGLSDKRVLVLQAPAGYGKTTLMMQWRREVVEGGAMAMWLALDERATPARLVRGLQAALAIAGGDALAARIPGLTWDEGASAIDSLTAWLALIALLSSDACLFSMTCSRRASRPCGTACVTWRSMRRRP